jgi:hypothetical protein
MKICTLALVLCGTSLLTTLGSAQTHNSAQIIVNRPVTVVQVKPQRLLPAPNSAVVAPKRIQSPSVRISTPQIRSRNQFATGFGNQAIKNSPYPILDTPANEARAANDAWASYRASLQAPTEQRIRATRNAIQLRNNPQTNQQLLIEQPTGPSRYNFQFSNNEVRSVQQSLQRLGLYGGATDGYLGPETQRAIEAYQVKNNLPVTGAPDRVMYSQLGIVR